MSSMDSIVKTAIMTLLALSTATANHALAVAESAPTEKCYGVVKTGMNDCQTATASCAGSATKDNQPDAFIFLPKGVCNKLVGGSLSAKTGSDKK